MRGGPEMHSPLACITVCDAVTGDAYVVDLRTEGDHESVASWNRFIIDTGLGMAESQERRGGPRGALQRALFDKYAATAEGVNDNPTLPPPWNDGQQPKICGVQITHTDSDHWGNAKWLMNLLKERFSDLDKDKKARDKFIQNPLPIYTSPMIDWTEDVLTRGITLGFLLHNASSFNITAEKANAKKKTAQTVQILKAPYIKTNNKEKKGPLDKQDMEEEQKQDLGEINGQDEEEDSFDLPSLDLSETAEMTALEEEYRAGGNFCDLQIGVKISRIPVKRQQNQQGVQGKSKGGMIIEDEAGKDGKKEMELEDNDNRSRDHLQPVLTRASCFVRWVHKEIPMDFSCSFRSIDDLAKILGYRIHYRWNLQASGGPKVPTPGTEFLFTSLSEAWILKNTATHQMKWSGRPNFTPSPKDFEKVGGESSNITVIGECRLVPPKRNAKRSYSVKASDPNQILAGYWLRSIKELNFSNSKLLDTANNQIENQAKVIKSQLDRRRLKSITVTGRDSKIEEEKPVIFDTLFGNTEVGTGLRLDVTCVGYQDYTYSLKYFPHRPYTFYQDTYTGCAGTRFSRDFLHMATQVALAPQSTGYVAKLIEAETRIFKFMKLNPAYLEMVDLISNYSAIKKRVLGWKKMEPDGKAAIIQSLDSQVTKYQLEINQLEPTFDELVAAKKEARKMRTADRKRPGQWGHAANRASVITHFCFDATRNENRVKFDMLFTGDAFELGSNDSQPYAPHLRPSRRSFAQQSVARTRTIEKPDSVISNPNGNIISWLIENHSLGSMRVGVLKLPHHGSSNTTGSAFYSLVSASVYLISGSNSPHGHPRPETLQSIVDTIVREDGNAKAPKNFLSKDERSKQEKYPIFGKVSTRKRPRLIFATFQTCSGKLIMSKEEREAEEKVLLERKKMTGRWRTPNDSADVDPPTEPKKKPVGGKQPAQPKDQLPKGSIQEEKTEKKKPGRPAKNKGTTDPPVPPQSDLPQNEPKQPDDKAQKLIVDPGDEESEGSDSGESNETPKKNYIDLKSYVYFYSKYLGGLQDKVDKTTTRANVRIFVQKKAASATRLKIGYDANQPDKVRVEWSKDDWQEIRCDEPPTEPFFDPLAYPETGQDPDWDADRSYDDANDQQQLAHKLLPIVKRVKKSPQISQTDALIQQWNTGILRMDDHNELLALDKNNLTFGDTGDMKPEGVSKEKKKGASKKKSTQHTGLNRWSPYTAEDEDIHPLRKHYLTDSGYSLFSHATERDTGSMEEERGLINDYDGVFD